MTKNDTQKKLGTSGPSLPLKPRRRPSMDKLTPEHIATLERYFVAEKMSYREAREQFAKAYGITLSTHALCEVYQKQVAKTICPPREVRVELIIPQGKDMPIEIRVSRHGADQNSTVCVQRDTALVSTQRV